MERSLPAFVRDPGGRDAVVEFRTMMSDVGEEGAHFLAELTDIQNFRSFDDLPYQDMSRIDGLLIRYLRDWAVFYMAIREPFLVTVVHVARFKRGGYSDRALFLAARDEALNRAKLI